MFLSLRQSLGAFLLFGSGAGWLLAGFAAGALKISAFAVVFGVLPGSVLAALVWFLLPSSQRSFRWLGGAFVWGAVVATGWSAALNTAGSFFWEQAFGVRSADTFSKLGLAPVLEESFKAWGVVWVFRRSQLEDRMSGFLLATTVGLGFGALENIDYLARFGSTWDVLGDRFLALLLHPTMTSSFGVLFGLATSQEKKAVRLGLLGFGLVSAISLHAGANLLEAKWYDIDGPCTIAMIMWLSLGGVLWISRRQA